MKPTHVFIRLAACALVLGASSCTSAPDSTPAPDAAVPEVAEPAEVQPASVREPEVEKLEIETLTFEIEIAAPVETVWDTMLDHEGYTQWTAPFLAGSTFEGSWTEGERMLFLGPGRNGMVAEIAVNRPHEELSIRHLGFMMGGAEDTTSDAVRSWAPAYEIYRFETVPGGTKVKIEHEVITHYVPYMQSVWPRALEALKSLCEAG